VLITSEYLVDKMAPVDVVAKLPSSWFYDDASQVLTLNTSDGRPPAEHEMELIQRGDGIFVRGKHHVTVVGFTFRHMQDAGVSFFIDSSDGVIMDVTSWGSRQGVRVYGAKSVFLYGNTLFRNENSGVYFAAKSVNGLAVGNTAYENVKGPLDRYPTLAEYRTAKGQDLHSREGACGSLPAKVDVHALHATTLAYPGRPPASQTAGVRGWLDWLRGR